MSYERLCNLLVELIQTPGDDLETARKLWLELKPLISNLHLFRDHLRNPETYRLVGGLERSASKFLRSLNASTGPLKNEWRKLALVDLDRLKDSASALYEHTTERGDELREVLNRVSFLASRRPDPIRIFDELREAGAISEHTWSLIRKFNKSELHAPQVQKQMDLLAQLLFELKEAERFATSER